MCYASAGTPVLTNVALSEAHYKKGHMDFFFLHSQFRYEDNISDSLDGSAGKGAC